MPGCSGGRSQASSTGNLTSGATPEILDCLFRLKPPTISSRASTPWSTRAVRPQTVNTALYALLLRRLPRPLRACHDRLADIGTRRTHVEALFAILDHLYGDRGYHADLKNKAAVTKIEQALRACAPARHAEMEGGGAHAPGTLGVVVTPEALKFVASGTALANKANVRAPDAAQVKGKLEMFVTDARGALVEVRRSGSGRSVGSRYCRQSPGSLPDLLLRHIGDGHAA